MADPDKSPGASDSSPRFAVVFDKDGTLLDFSKTWNSPFGVMIRGVVTAEGESEPDPDRLVGLASALGYDLAGSCVLPDSVLIAASNDVIAEILEPFAVDDGAMLRGYLAARDMTATTMTPMPHALETLHALRDRGVLLAIATNDSESGAHRMIEAFGWPDIFESVVGFDSGYGAKPGPGMVLGALSELGVDPGNAIMIGDSSHDIDSGRAAGTTTVAIGDADVGDVDHRIADLSALVAVAESTFELAEP